MRKNIVIHEGVGNPQGVACKVQVITANSFILFLAQEKERKRVAGRCP